ncbi:UNVERIFIED_ORG: hypothetical protein ABID57_002563 [Arthrobacter sp. UYEF1]
MTKEVRGGELTFGHLDYTELLHQPEVIAVRPVLDDLSVLDPMDRYRGLS